MDECKNCKELRQQIYMLFAACDAYRKRIEELEEEIEGLLNTISMQH